MKIKIALVLVFCSLISLGTCAEVTSKSMPEGTTTAGSLTEKTVKAAKDSSDGVRTEKTEGVLVSPPSSDGFDDGASTQCPSDSSDSDSEGASEESIRPSFDEKSVDTVNKLEVSNAPQLVLTKPIDKPIEIDPQNVVSSVLSVFKEVAQNGEVDTLKSKDLFGKFILSAEGKKTSRLEKEQCDELYNGFLGMCPANSEDGGAAADTISCEKFAKILESIGVVFKEEDKKISIHYESPEDGAERRYIAAHYADLNHKSGQLSREEFEKTFVQLLNQVMDPDSPRISTFGGGIFGGSLIFPTFSGWGWPGKWFWL